MTPREVSPVAPTRKTVPIQTSTTRVPTPVHTAVSPSIADSLDRPSSPPSQLTLRAPPPTSQVQAKWTPSHTPLWSLGPQHRNYVHAAVPYLLSVPGGSEWECLLASYITFEGLSSSTLVSAFIYYYVYLE